MTGRQVSVSVSVVVAEDEASAAAYGLTAALVEALPAASQGSLSIVVLDEDQEVPASD